jgi:glycerophosphoryl diester phosphodiesterase
MAEQREHTVFLGHRGAPHEAPENTLAAFQRAFTYGIDGVETDVQRTADGHLVLIHDDRVDRTTNGQGNVRELKWDELRALDAGQGERIPSLDELLALAASQPTPPFLNLELKMPGVGPDTLAALAAARYPGPVALSSFDYPTLVETRRYDAAVELWVLSDHWDDDLPARAHAIGATCLDLHYRLIDDALVARAAAAGLGITAWTVDEPDDLRHVLALRPAVRALCTNRPDRMRKSERGTRN